MIQAGGPGEAPWHARHVQRAQDRIGIAVGANQHGVVAGSTASSQRGRDPFGDGIGLVGSGVERQELDLHLGRAGPSAPSARHESLVDPLAGLEPIGIVVPDQAV